MLSHPLLNLLDTPTTQVLIPRLVLVLSRCPIPDGVARFANPVVVHELEAFILLEALFSTVVEAQMRYFLILR